MSNSYDDFIFVSSKASYKASCLDKSWGCTFASASSRVMSATTWGVGVPSGLDENIEPRLIIRRLQGVPSINPLVSKRPSDENAERLRVCKAEKRRLHDEKAGFGLAARANETRNVPTN